MADQYTSAMYSPLEIDFIFRWIMDPVLKNFNHTFNHAELLIALPFCVTSGLVSRKGIPCD